MNLIHYVIVRRDIHRTVRGTGIGALAAQVVHAAGVSGVQAVRARWINGIPDDTIACVLGVPNERALKALEARMKKHGIQHHAVREPDAPWNGALMAIGVWPVTQGGRVSKLLSRYKLL
jgi:peptidyl-tRNA hydrolase